MQKRISNFLSKKYLCSLATVENNQATWSFVCYYVFDKTNQRLIYIANDQTKHAQLMAKNPNVSGTIFTPTKFRSSLQSLQFTGLATKLEGESARIAKDLYKAEHHHPLIDEQSPWEIKLTFVRLTDNSLGLFSKMEWRLGESTDGDEFETVQRGLD